MLASSCWTMTPQAEAVGLEPTSGMSPPPVFKTGSSSGRMASVRSSCGGWNRTNMKTFRTSRPTVRRPRIGPLSSGRRIRTSVAWFKARKPTASRSPIVIHLKCPMGVEPISPAWRAGAFAARPRARLQAEGEGVEPSRLIARPLSRRLPSPIGLSFRLRRQESNLRHDA